jgi:hypothetical protein
MQVYLMAINPRLSLKQPETVRTTSGSIKKANDDVLDDMLSVYSYRSIDAIDHVFRKAAGSIRNRLIRH